MNGSTQAVSHSGVGERTGEVDIHAPFTPGQRIQQLSEVDKDTASLLAHLSSAMRALATPPGTSVAQHTTTATATTTTNGTTPSDIPIADADAEAEAKAESETDPHIAFQKAQSAFFQTIDRIDKQLTRQILALEEAGIITLRNSAEQPSSQQQGAEPRQQQQQQGGPGQQHLSQSQQQQQQQQQGSAARRAKGASPVKLEPDGLGRYGQLEVGQLNLASSTVEKDMEAELWRRARERLGEIVAAGEGEHGDRMEE